MKQKLNYKEFINALDLSNMPSVTVNEKLEKEKIDNLISNINNKFLTNYFNKNRMFVSDKNTYNDPNLFVTELSENKCKTISETTIKPNVYSACLSYSSCLSNTAKDQPVVKLKQLQKKHETPTIVKHPALLLPKTRVNINVEIADLDGLIQLINDHPPDETKEYNINMNGLHKIHSSLIDLKNMIGMKDLKENVVDQILYFIQDFHKCGDFMHTVIYGPPGTGKTEMAKIIGQIFSKLGVLKKGTFKKVTRSDLIAGYLGQTAIKTRDVINECLGGVLFIDEAYALGNSEKRDTFSKECIDTLCEALSNHKEELMVIIAGYESELKECFFNYNQGLDSRFTWRFKTDEYKGEELYSIFLKKVADCKWTIDSDLEEKNMQKWFSKNLCYFKFFGRDIETLLAKTKIVHGRRVFCKPIEEKMKINLRDLEKGFELYLKNDEVKKRKDGENIKYLLKTMYV